MESPTPESRKRRQSTPPDSESDDDGKKRRGHVADPIGAQKRQLEKLFERIDKPIQLPESSKQSGLMLKPPPDFVRNVSGSSAGAGSGEFHVYRALRRKEQTRVKMMEEESSKEIAQQEFDLKMAKLREEQEARTAKKRAKRQKKKGKTGKKAGAAGDSAREEAGAEASASEGESERSAPFAPPEGEEEGLVSADEAPGSAEHVVGRDDDDRDEVRHGPTAAVGAGGDEPVPSTVATDGSSVKKRLPNVTIVEDFDF
ncbi:hypothetical protein DFJ74DRAFT_651546 [Hyaloraphidium curvatum]|nr:hypothetical protein DFJ74DRAFT_651546 [Hyaloraphidium curvatum]